MFTFPGSGHEAHFCLFEIDLGRVQLRVNFSCSFEESPQINVRESFTASSWVSPCPMTGIHVAGDFEDAHVHGRKAVTAKVA